MAENACNQMNFVLAVHDDEFAGDIGRALLTDDITRPDVVAIEWAYIGKTPEEVAKAITKANQIFERITDSASTEETASGDLAELGGFYSKLLRPLVGSQVKIELIDSYEYPDLGKRSTDFFSYELDERLADVITKPKMSVDCRKQEMLSIAAKCLALNSVREQIVQKQLETLAQKHSFVSVFQGVNHEVTADSLETQIKTVKKIFIPEIKSWPGQPTLNSSQQMQFSKLERTIQAVGVDNVPDQVVERALLAEYVGGYLLHTPYFDQQVVNQYGAIIAAGRIVESLGDDRLKGKLKAAVKCSNGNGSIAKVITPMIPRHSINVFA